MDAEEVLREVYSTSYRRLVGQLTAVTGSYEEAEDVVQDAFARGLQHPGTIVGVQNPEAWLRTVAVNQARSRWRRTRRFVGLLPDLLDDPPHQDEAVLDLLAALRLLSRTQREAIALHYIVDLPLNEVADILGVPVGTVKARLSRGRAALAGQLAMNLFREESTHG